MRKISAFGIRFFFTLILSGAAAFTLAGTAETVEKITGLYLGSGVTCPQFKMDTGEIVSLSGVTERDLAEYANTKVLLTGEWWAMSTCMQGRDFHVATISVAD